MHWVDGCMISASKVAFRFICEKERKKKKGGIPSSIHKVGGPKMEQALKWNKL